MWFLSTFRYQILLYIFSAVLINTREIGGGQVKWLFSSLENIDQQKQPEKKNLKSKTIWAIYEKETILQLFFKFKANVIENMILVHE